MINQCTIEQFLRPIEMESMRRYEDQIDSDVATPNTMLLPRALEPIPPVHNEITYAQIVRPDRVPVLPQPQPEEEIDFRLQTPVQQLPANYQYENASGPSPLTSGGSSISSGYIDLTQPSTGVQRRNWRPTSPETSF